MSEEECLDINRLLINVEKRFCDKVFIQSVEDGRSITFEQFFEECNRLAHFLKSRGLKANDRLVLIGPNCIEWIIIFFGTLKYGATIVPVPEEYPDEKINLILNRVEPKYIFLSKELSKHLLWEGHEKLIPFGHWDEHDVKKIELFSLTRDFSGQFLEESVANRNDISVINITSGTMEEPRCVLRSYESFLSLIDVIERFGITDKDTLLEYRSFNWLSTIGLTLTSSVLSGSTLIIAKKFSRSHFFEWLKQYRITISAGVPTVLNMLLAQPVEVKKEDFPDLRFMTSSSAPLFSEKQKKFEALYGIPIVQFMGMTEGGLIASNSPENRKTGSVGYPPSHATVSIEDEEGNILGPGEEGEIVIQGKQVAQGYLMDGGKVENFAPDGRLKIGDMGFLDKDGWLFVTGRKKNLIIRGGINISPLQISGALLEHPSVEEVETLNVPDPIYGEEAVCLVKLKSMRKATTEELMAHCESKLSRQMLPKEILIVEEIPKTERGKVSKSKLIEMYLSRKRGSL